MAQDWPNLKKYREANEKILQTGNYPTVVFMGNSITEGWANKHPDFFKNNNYAGRGSADKPRRRCSSALCPM